MVAAVWSRAPLRSLDQSEEGRYPWKLSRGRWCCCSIEESRRTRTAFGVSIRIAPVLEEQAVEPRKCGSEGSHDDEP